MSDTRAPLIWLHDDCLRPDAPPLEAYPDAPAVYLLDEAVITHRLYGLKRLTFIYESAMALPVTLYRGALLPGLAALAAEHGTAAIATTATPCPHLRSVMDRLVSEYGLKIERLPEPPLVRLAKKPDLKRFSRYWRQAQKTAFDTGAGSPDLPLFDRPLP